MKGPAINSLTKDQKAEIVEKTKTIRDNHPEITLLEICTSMVHHFAMDVDVDSFAPIEAIILCVQAYHNVEKVEVEHPVVINKNLN